MNDDLEAIDGLCAKIIEQRDRIEALEAALRDIMMDVEIATPVRAFAKAVLAPEQDK